MLTLNLFMATCVYICMIFQAKKSLNSIDKIKRKIIKALFNTEDKRLRTSQLYLLKLIAKISFENNTNIRDLGPGPQMSGLTNC